MNPETVKNIIVIIVVIILLFVLWREARSFNKKG